MRKLTDTDIYEYLFILEHRLLVESVRHTIELTHNWAIPSLMNLLFICSVKMVKCVM